jgi:integrase
VILGVLCGLRRGEVVALRWQQVDLANAQLAVVESAEQTGEGVRYKRPKSGRARTVALSPIVAEELRAHQLRQAEGRSNHVASRTPGGKCSPRRICPEFGFMICGTHLLSSGVHPKVASERLGHSKVGITPTRMSSPACRPMPRSALTRPFE